MLDYHFLTAQAKAAQILLVVSTLVAPRLAQAEPPASFRVGANEYPAYYSLDWMNEKLTGDDKPYRLIRTQIDKAVKARTLTNQSVARYKAAYDKKPHDPLSLFCWAYALYSKPQAYWRDRISTLVMERFWRVTSPHVYQYARLRWMAQAVLGPQRADDKEKLGAFGQRLLLRNANDLDVLYRLVDYVPEDKALAYAERMARMKPKSKGVISTLAFARFNQFLHTHSQKDADAAVAAHERLLKMLPASDKDGREDVLRTIAHIRQVRARWVDKVS